MSIKFSFRVLCMLSATLPAIAQGNKCTLNVPIQATFLATSAPTNAIANDNPSQAYVDGSNGVTAIIHRCGSTNDATINLQNSKRKLTIQFPAPEAGSLYPGISAPSFAGGASFSTAAFVSVANLLGTSSTVFYTRGSIDFSLSKSKNYTLWLHPPDNSCPGDYPCVPFLNANTGPSDENYPKSTAWMKVTYTPAPAGQAGAQWVVDGTFVRPGETTSGRATLDDQSPSQHLGQYQMPFKLVITALAPL